MSRALPLLACFCLLLACSGRDRPGTDYEYTPCASDADCRGPARCREITWRDGSGRMCTAPCTGVCPHDGRCLDVTRDGTFLCFAPCAYDRDCPATFICQPVTTGGAVCLP